jgi:hypothetical protein
MISLRFHPPLYPLPLREGMRKLSPLVGEGWEREKLGYVMYNIPSNKGG